MFFKKILMPIFIALMMGGTAIASPSQSASDINQIFNNINNGNIETLSSNEMQETEGEFIPLAILAIRAAYTGYSVYKNYKRGKAVYSIYKNGKKINNVGKVITKGRSVTNTVVNSGKKSFENSLKKQGYSKYVSRDGKANIFIKGSDKIVTRGYSKQGSPTADLYRNGRIVEKVRFTGH